MKRGSLTFQLAFAFAFVAIATAVISAVVITVTWQRQFEVYIERGVQERADEAADYFGTQYERAGDWATAGCAVVMRKSGNTVSHIRIALTNVAPTALRAEAAEQAVLGKALDEATLQAAADAAMAICEPAEDLRGDQEYKTAMAGQMVRRALSKAWARCA